MFSITIIDIFIKKCKRRTSSLKIVIDLNYINIYTIFFFLLFYATINEANETIFLALLNKFFEYPFNFKIKAFWYSTSLLKDASDNIFTICGALRIAIPISALFHSYLSVIPLYIKKNKLTFNIDWNASFNYYRTSKQNKKKRI